MLLLKTEKRSSDVPFNTLLQHCQKSTMLRLADFFGMPVKRSAKKVEFLNDMAMAIEIGARFWIPLLPKYELDLLIRVLEAPKDEGVTIYKPYPGLGLFIGEMCVVVGRHCKSDPEKWTLFLSTESIRYDMEAGVKCALERNEKNPELIRWEQLGLGLLNYFGLMPVSDFYDEMKRRTGVKSMSKEERALSRLIHTYPLFNSMTYDVDDGKSKTRFISTPFIDDTGRVLDEQDSRVDLFPDFTKPTEDELMAYGSRPFVLPCNAHEKRMYQYLCDELKIDKDRADWMYHRIWCLNQSDRKPTEILSWLNQQAEFHSINELQNLMDVFTQFSNNTPKWILCGWSSHEVFEKFEKPRLRPLPSMPFNPYSSSVNGVPFYKGGSMSAKVGRNDPCPCGSGKKYKNCCGRYDA